MLTINLKSGRRIIIDCDECAENPRREFGAETRLLIVPNRDFEGDETKDWPEIRAEAKAAKAAGAHVFIVYAYVHSGVALSLSPFSCERDSGAAGVIIVPADVPEEHAFNFAKGEIEMLNQYFAGCVYWVRVESPTGFCGKTDDCIGGIYADSEGEAAREAVSDYLDLTDDERTEALAALA
jgi:hypothetical protein